MLYRSDYPQPQNTPRPSCHAVCSLGISYHRSATSKPTLISIGSAHCCASSAQLDGRPTRSADCDCEDNFASRRSGGGWVRVSAQHWSHPPSAAVSLQPLGLRLPSPRDIELHPQFGRPRRGWMSREKVLGIAAEDVPERPLTVRSLLPSCKRRFFVHPDPCGLLGVQRTNTQAQKLQTSPLHPKSDKGK